MFFFCPNKKKNRSSNQPLSQQQKTATILSSYSNRCRSRQEDENRFVYGRYRHPTQRHPIHQPHSPHSTHSYGHAHHSHSHGHTAHGHSSHHSSHTHLHQDDGESIYETADHHQSMVVDARINDRETPDSER